MIDLTFDERSGVIHVVGTGAWSAIEVDTHFGTMEVLMRSLRLQGRPVRVLSDVTGAEIQSPEIEARINAHSVRLHEPGDRVALITKNSMMKAHARAVSESDELALFCSRAAAEMWLTARDGFACAPVAVPRPVAAREV